MADSGLLASFVFGATTINADDCVQNTSLTRVVNTSQYQCSGAMAFVAGATTYQFTAQLALAADDTAVVAAFAEGSTGTFQYDPGGDVTGNIEMTSTKAIVTQANVSAAANGFITMDITLGLDDLTDATAAT